MIDIAKKHRGSGSPKVLAKFFKSKAYTQAYTFLRNEGYGPDAIARKQHAYRGTPGIAFVHPLVALEYARWVDYDSFAAKILK